MDKQKDRITNAIVDLFNNDLTISECQFNQTHECEIMGKAVVFNITAGPMLFKNRPLDQKNLVEIHYKFVQDKQNQRLPLGGTKSKTYLLHLEKALELASGFCAKEGWIIEDHHHSWQSFQAVAIKQTT